MRFLDLLSGHGRFPAPGLPRAFLPQWTLCVRAVQFHLIGVLGLLFLLFRFMAAEEVSKKSLLLFLLLRQLPLFLLAAGVTERAVFIGHGIVPVSYTHLLDIDGLIETAMQGIERVVLHP